MLFLFLSPTYSGGFAAVAYTNTLHAAVMVLGSNLLMGFGKSILENWAPWVESFSLIAVWGHFSSFILQMSRLRLSEP